jgi:multiple sugar transport system substrate-binding protein
MLKKLSRRILSILLVVLLVGSLAACNKSTDTKEDETTDKGDVTVAATNDKPKEKVTITYWHIFPEGDAFKAVNDKLIKDFNESQDEVFVDDLGISFFDFLSKMDTAIPAGTGPDVAFYSAEDSNFRAAAGVLANLKPYIDADGFDMSQFYEGAVKQVTYEDGIYAMPYTWSSRMLVYNKQMFRDAGLDPDSPPKTLEELADYSEKLTKVDADGKIEVMGFHPSLGNAAFADYLEGRGGSFFDENQNPIINSQTVIDTLQWYVDMTNKYGVKEAQSLKSTSATTGLDPFLAGYVAMEVNVNDFYKKLSESDIDYGICAIPIPAEGGVHAADGGGFDLEVFDHGDQAKIEAAWKFISYMTSVESQQYWAVQNKWPVANQTAMETSEEIKADPNWQTIVAELPYAVPNQYITKVKNWWNAISPEIEAAQSGIKTPKEALDAAQAAVEAQIESYDATN